MHTICNHLPFSFDDFVTNGGEEGGTEEEVEEVGDTERPQTPAWRHPEHDHHYLDRAEFFNVVFPQI